jgi:DNA-binding SARP family transcriptional activator
MAFQGTFSDDSSDPLLQGFMPRPPFEIDLLGGFTLRVCGKAVTVGHTGQRLLALLALRGRSTRTSAAYNLWPQTPQTAALARLRTTIWRCRCAAGDLIEARRDVLALSSEARVNVIGDAAPEADLLPGWDDDWLIIDRERLRQHRLAHLDALATSLAMRHAYQEALDLTLRVLAVEPLRESSHQLVISIHLAQNNRAEAVRAYQRCAHLLRRELGVEPSTATRALLATGPTRVTRGMNT